jgi:hypothetical protein
MPATPTPAQSLASRRNGACSTGPATEAGKARPALDGVRHGLSGRTFFLLADEDPAAFEEHEAVGLAAWRPRDLHEHEAALAAIRAMWREVRADRLEALVLGDLFAAGGIEDEAERQAAKDRAFRGLLATLLRYQARIGREHRAAMQALDALRQRRLARAPARPGEPEPRALNRHQHRAQAAIERQGLRRAALACRHDPSRRVAASGARRRIPVVRFDRAGGRSTAGCRPVRM